jgi:GLPGLI family protein
VSTPSFSQLFTVYPEKEIGQADIIVTYLKTQQQDSLNSRKRKDNMILLIGKNISSFYSESTDRFINATHRFSNIADFQAFLSDPANNIRTGGSLYRVYKNFNEKEITTTDHIPSDSYLYKENLNLFDWKISGETDSLFGYKVQRATTCFGGREWIAWFAPEIPFNDGPYKFNGLPGLILKIHDTRNHYAFEVVSIETPKEKTPIHFTEQTFIITTKDRFFRAWNSFLDSGFLGTDVVPLNQSRNTMSNPRSRFNNSIELN